MHKEPQTRRLDDADAEAVRVSHHAAIRELQAMPVSALKLVLNIELPNGIDVLIPHGLGRAPVMHWVSTVRGPTSGVPTVGVIEEYRSGVDRALYIKLSASGYGATVTVDLAVL